MALAYTFFSLLSFNNSTNSTVMLRYLRTEVTDGVASDGEKPADLRLEVVPYASGVVIDIGSVGKRIGSW